MQRERDTSDSPPRHQNTRSLPLSFAYGAPEVSPPHGHQTTNDQHESAAVRYARLKDRQHSAAPGTIISPPVPTSVKDTSVNIASAFSQAAMSYSRRSADPGENDPGRRLAVPPSRLAKVNLRKGGGAGRVTVSPAGDSDSESNAPRPAMRAKSPFGALSQSFTRAISPAFSAVSRALSPPAPSTFVLREGGEDSESSGFQSFAVPSGKPSSKASTKNANNSNSYDYAQEEEDVENMETDSSPSKKSHSKRRSGRVSIDNKAYKPGAGEESDDEDYTDDDGHRRRRKKKRTNALHLPTIGYDKTKKKKPTTRKRGPRGVGDEDGASGSERGSVARSVRGSVPPMQREPEPEDSHVEDSGVDFTPDFPSADYSAADYSAADVSAMLQTQVNGKHLEEELKPRESRRRWFGRSLGVMVRSVIDFSKAIVYFMTRILGALMGLVLLTLQSSWQLAVRNPITWLSTLGTRFTAVLPKLIVLVTVGFVLYMATMSLSGVSRGVLDYINRPAPVYQAPNIPAADLSAALQRLRTVENALEQISSQLKTVSTRSDDLSRSVLTAQTQVEGESRRAAEAEEKLRNSAAKTLGDVRSEIAALQGSIGSKVDSSSAWLELEKRVASNEAELKTIKVHPVSSDSISWPKPGTKSVTLRASDGTDVTKYISSLVDHAVGVIARDGTGRPDYALFTSGGRIIPALTSSRFVMSPTNWRRKVVGWVTGYGYTMGHEPAVALHPDISLGNCWPFAGSQGQLGVVLARPVMIDSFTIEHAPREITYGSNGNGSAAPRHMEVWGFVDGRDNRAKVAAFYEIIELRHEEAVRAAIAAHKPAPQPLDEADAPGTGWRAGHYVLLGRFEYDVTKPNHLQTFTVRPEIQGLDVDFGIVQLRIQDNWGEPAFTCLYRFRVHGTERASISS
ncbi:hypothetical protein BKA62DRAFT_691493 [Auriculariales sp. MPI-PUGE-AT-0066]|nr:hypothetical protein BKA62DRAFT_691493 [Auriculariales sp. MPI-PUGE-AT-0066]